MKLLQTIILTLYNIFLVINTTRQRFQQQQQKFKSKKFSPSGAYLHTTCKIPIKDTQPLLVKL